MGDVVVKLYEAPGAQVATVDATPIATTTTNAAGAYLFSDLPAGDYYLVFSAPAGYGFTRHDVAGNSQDNDDSDAVAPQILATVSNPAFQPTSMPI